MREKLIELLNNSFEKQYEKRGLLTAPHTAEDLIANGVTVTDNHVGGKWISVKERLPQSGKCVLVYSKSGGVAEGRFSAYDKKWVQFRWSVKDLEVTHWMPLPEPPKGE